MSEIYMNISLPIILIGVSIIIFVVILTLVFIRLLLKNKARQLIELIANNSALLSKLADAIEGEFKLLTNKNFLFEEKLNQIENNTKLSKAEIISILKTKDINTNSSK